MTAELRKSADYFDSAETYYSSALNILTTLINVLHKMIRWISKYRKDKKVVFMILKASSNDGKVLFPAEILPSDYVQMRKIADLLNTPQPKSKEWQQATNAYLTQYAIIATILYKGFNYSQIDQTIQWAGKSEEMQDLWQDKYTCIRKLTILTGAIIEALITRYNITPLLGGQYNCLLTYRYQKKKYKTTNT